MILNGWARRIRGLWWARQRAADLKMLWPACKRHASSLDEARMAFAYHARACPCWVAHFGDGLAAVIVDLQ